MRWISTTGRSTALVRLVVLDAPLQAAEQLDSSKNRKRALASWQFDSNFSSSLINTFRDTLADSSDRHVMDEAHLKPLVLDNSSSTAGCSTYFATSY
ncbi:Chaperonin GroEL [Trichinella pseudospiralis]